MFPCPPRLCFSRSGRTTFLRSTSFWLNTSHGIGSITRIVSSYINSKSRVVGSCTSLMDSFSKYLYKEEIRFFFSAIYNIIQHTTYASWLNKVLYEEVFAFSRYPEPFLCFVLFAVVELWLRSHDTCVRNVDTDTNKFIRWMSSEQTVIPRAYTKRLS